MVRLKIFAVIRAYSRCYHVRRIEMSDSYENIDKALEDAFERNPKFKKDMDDATKRRAELMKDNLEIGIMKFFLHKWENRG